MALFAGDASGDYQSALLVKALRRHVPGLTVWGVGGRRLQEAGADLLFDTSRASAIGVVQASKLIIPGLLTERRAQRRIVADPPDFALAVDFGAFNLRIAPFLRASGVPVAYWFPPGSWRRTPPSERIVNAADYFISPYPWYAESLRAAGAKADFLGHPLLDQTRPVLSKEQFLGRLGLDEAAECVALLPGSRGHEVQNILPVMIEAAAVLTQRRPGAAFVVPLSDHYPSREAVALTRRSLDGVKRKGLPQPAIGLVRSGTQEAICHARAAAVCSGSATLEALVALTPMVVVYRGTSMMKLEYRVRRMNIQYMGMPNILADKMIVPELRQDEATAEAIALRLERLLDDTPERTEQVEALQGLREMLEPSGATERTADALLRWLRDVRAPVARAGGVA